MLQMEYKIIVEVKEIEFPNGCDLQVGDSFELEEDKISPTRKRICAFALNAIYPFAYALRFGAELSWAKNGEEWLLCCPDTRGRALFRLKRVPIQTSK